MALRRLAGVFARSEASTGRTLPIHKTASGTWVPTPVPLIEETVARLRATGLLGEGAPPEPLIDAGAGDGRVAAVLAALSPRHMVYGVESDPGLYARAVANLEALADARLVDPARLRLVEGDYCLPATYGAADIPLDRSPLVFNYPDGNHRRLAAFLAAHAGPATRLCLPTHDRTLRLDELPLEAAYDLQEGWRLSVYAMPG